MKKIEGFFSWDSSLTNEKLKVGELVEVNGRVYRYGRDKNDVHSLDPVEGANALQ
jgi:hypothetical protein